MTEQRRPRFTLIQTLALIALVGAVLTVVLPRLLERTADGTSGIEPEQSGTGSEIED